MKSQFKRSFSLICVFLLFISVLSLSACGQGTKSFVGTWVGSIEFGNIAITSISFYNDGSFFAERDVHDDIIGTYTIVRDGAAIILEPTDSFRYDSITFEYKLLSNDSLVLYINGSEYTLQRAD